MALDTYANLQTAIQTELRRTDSTFTGSIPDLITRAEVKLNRNPRIRDQEQLSYIIYDTTATEKRIALPSDFIEMLSLKIRETDKDDTNFSGLKHVAPAQFHRKYVTPQRPQYYTLRDQIELNCLPDTSYYLRMHYLKKWNISADSTNWLLTHHPDAYLYGALTEAALFLKAPDNILMRWKAAFNEVVRDLETLDDRSRDDTEMDTSEYRTWRHRYGYNINRDTF